MTSADAATGAAAAVEVRAGGVPTAEQLAAIVVALTPGGAAGSDPAPPTLPAWTAAALVEGVDGSTVVRPSGLERFDPRG